jgi:hypothetical protein
MKYIDEEQLRELVSREIFKLGKRSKIKSVEGFTNHLISTGHNAQEISMAALKRNPSLEGEIDSDRAATAGRLHDLGKALYSSGDRGHDVLGAYWILTQGGASGIVSDATPEQVRSTLGKLALAVASDFSLAEELGVREGFPQRTYPLPEDFDKKVDYIREFLSVKGNPLPIERLVYPDTDERKIIVCADLTNLSGKKTFVRERLDEVVARYERWGKTSETQEERDYFSYIAEITKHPGFRDRIFKVVKKVEGLTGMELL